MNKGNTEKIEQEDDGKEDTGEKENENEGEEKDDDDDCDEGEEE